MDFFPSSFIFVLITFPLCDFQGIKLVEEGITKLSSHSAQREVLNSIGNNDIIRWLCLERKIEKKRKKNKRRKSSSVFEYDSSYTLLNNYQKWCFVQMTLGYEFSSDEVPKIFAVALSL